LELATNKENTDLVDYIQQKIDKNKVVPKKFWERQMEGFKRFTNKLANRDNKPKAGKRTAKKSRKMRKRKFRKTRRVR
jgi:hypothetical protein